MRLYSFKRKKLVAINAGDITRMPDSTVAEYIPPHLRDRYIALLRSPMSYYEAVLTVYAEYVAELLAQK